MPYKTGKLLRIVREHLEDFNRQRDKVITKYAEKDEDGNPILAKDEQGNELPNQFKMTNWEEVVKQLSEIGTEEISFDLPVELTLEDLDEEGVKIKGTIIEGIIPILDACS